jgi:hypothetical protein
MKKFSIFIFALFIPVAFLLTPVIVSAQFDPLETSCLDKNGDRRTDSAVCNEVTAQETADQNPLIGPDGTITQAANLIALATAVIAVIVIIVAGLTMVLSSGDSGKVKSSRDAIIYAVVGLAVIALARSIVVFVVNRL